MYKCGILSGSLCTSQWCTVHTAHFKKLDSFSLEIQGFRDFTFRGPYFHNGEGQELQTWVRSIYGVLGVRIQGVDR